MAKKNEIPEIVGEEKAVDALYNIMSQVQSLKSKALVFENKLKEKGKGLITGFGTVNFIGKNAEAVYQIQVKRPTITLDHNGVMSVMEMIGSELTSLLFDVKITGKDIVKVNKSKALRDFIKKHGGDPEEFIALERTAKAQDALLNDAIFGRLVPDVKTRQKIIDAASVKGKDAGPSGGFKPKKDE